MKVFLKRALKFIVVFALVFFIPFYGQGRADHDTIRIRGFYMEDKNSLDVVLVGASELYADYSAAQAYKEQGFTSYPYAVEENVVDLVENELVEVFNNQSPKLLIIETNFAMYDNKNAVVTDARLRRVTDCMPMNQNKIDIIDRFGDKDNLLSYYLPFIKYHGHLYLFKDSLNDYALELRGFSYLKGMKTRTEAKNFKKYNIKEVDGTKPLAPVAEEKFREFLQICKDKIKDSKVVFVRFPHAIATEHMYDRYLQSNRVGEIVNEYGFDYINFEHNADEIGFDYSKDFYNYEHMNVRGLQKFTSYFAKTIADKYDIKPTQLTDEQKEKWDTSVEYTEKFYNYAESCINKGDEKWLFEKYKVMRELDK